MSLLRKDANMDFANIKDEFRKRQRRTAAAIDKPDEEYVDRVEEMR